MGPRNLLSFWSWVTWFKELWIALLWKFQGEVLHAQLQDQTSPVRSEAQIAVDRVVYETHLAPDCIIGTVVRGGPAILLKHDPHGNGATQTAFIGKTYEHAANEAIAWINAQGSELSTKKTTQLRRDDRRKFDTIRRLTQRRKKRRH